MSKSPAFQFYPQDYLSSARVAEMTLEEEGAYIRLLCYCWSTGSIPADPERCARLVGKGCSIEVATAVQRSFNGSPTDSQRLLHDRLEKEREIQKNRRDFASIAGKKSAEKRAQIAASGSHKRTKNERSTGVQRKSNSSSSSSDEDVCDFSKSQMIQFDVFWETYPRKKAKGSARKAWSKAIKKTSAAEIISAAEIFARESKGTDAQYIAYPATWLNAESWLDENRDDDKPPYEFDDAHFACSDEERNRQVAAVMKWEADRDRRRLRA